ncbi:MAG TPA: secondary thiamine-phosphate synthase enzyme YjbQ [Anaerolineae bacterium]|nr:secondary thiamine-phosphate synthase enzyme YjbQ [Anaerolineae bacterium]
MVTSKQLTLQTKGNGDTHDLTGAVGRAVNESGVRNGVVTLFVIGSTAGLTTIEYEPGAVADLQTAFERIAPRRGEYQHHLRWGDDNGHAHVRAALLGPSLSVPFVDGQLTLGTWQQIILVDFDTRPRRREVVAQIVGE